MKGNEALDRPRILIVEDDPLIARGLKRRLNNLGYWVVSVVSSGQQAIEAAKDELPDLALMDIMLEGDMDGTEAAAKIHSSLNIPTVFVTAHTEESVLAKAKIAEPFGYLVKPYNERELRSTIEVALYKSRTEQALVRAKEEWERTFDTVPDLIMILDDQHGIVRANKAAADRVGKRPEEMVGHRCYKIVCGEESPPRSCIHTRLLSDGRRHHAEISVCRWGGVFQVNVSPLHDAKGRMIGSVHVAHDVTSRKRAEQALMESEERLRLLVEHASDLVYRTDANGVFTFMNPPVLDLTGYSPEEVIGRNYLEFIHPEDKVKVEEFYGIQHANKIPQTYYEYRIVTRTGDSIWIGQHVRLLTDHDTVVGFQAIARDMTERKKAEDALKKAHDQLEERVRERTSELALVNEQLMESEARVRALFEAVEDCVFVQDRELRYTLVNPAMERLLDRPASEILGLTDEALFGEETGNHTRQVSSRVLRGQSIEEERSRLVRGIPTAFHEIRAPLRDSLGAVIGICGIARDITERKAATTPRSRDESLLHESSSMRRTLENARLAAGNATTVLLTGESGSGKDYLARYIHDHSLRAQAPYFWVNCGALFPGLAESELFGHERGAFTGATNRKRGLLELAEGGTLLLNEIGELPATLQVKLLSFLDTRQFTRVGGESRVTVDARLIAATNRDLEAEIAAGRFRKDLFYRLNVFSIEVPPLRKRRGDIPALVEKILGQLVDELQLSRIPRLDPSTLTAMAQYHWPGNVRELRNVLERSLILSKGETLQVDLGSPQTPIKEDWYWTATFPPEKPLNDMVRDLKLSLIREALEHSQGGKTRAANLLKISRDALRRQMKTLGLLPEN